MATWLSAMALPRHRVTTTDTSPLKTGRSSGCLAILPHFSGGFPGRCWKVFRTPPALGQEDRLFYGDLVFGVNFGTDTKGTLGKHGSEIRGTLSYQDLAILSNNLTLTNPKQRLQRQKGVKLYQMLPPDGREFCPCPTIEGCIRSVKRR